MKKQIVMLAATALISGAMGGLSVQAAAADDAVKAAYDSAVDMVDTMDGLDVTVEGSALVSGQQSTTEKTLHIQTSGMQSENGLKAAIEITTTDGNKEQYYTDGYFYSNQSGNNMKYAMDQQIMLELLNYYVYLDFNSQYLSSLDAEENADGTTTYTFTATGDTIGSYADKLLEGAQEEHKIQIVSINGSMKTNTDGYIAERQVEMVYSIKSDDQPKLCVANTDAQFNNPGQAVNVSLPSLSAYSEKTQAEAVISVTELSQTLYAASDVNVRAQNNVTAAIVGGIVAGNTMQETGYTSDGWIRISYDGAVGYVYSEYVSETKPVITTAMSGDMYATREVNVRSTYSTDGSVLGVLASGEAVATTGYTDNNWIRVSYNGSTGYVYADYLTWDAPVVNTTTYGYLEGTITDATMNTLSLTASNGSNYHFDTSYANMNTVDGLVIGDWVGVSYALTDGYYGATEVDDYNNHSYNSGSSSGNTMNDNNEDYADRASYGTVIAYGMSTVTVALDNGTSLSAEKDYLTVNGDLYEGAYVLAEYIGDYLYCITVL